jgi:hypothetical protein
MLTGRLQESFIEIAQVFFSYPFFPNRGERVRVRGAEKAFGIWYVRLRGFPSP